MRFIGWDALIIREIRPAGAILRFHSEPIFGLPKGLSLSYLLKRFSLSPYL
jgi:hypothetical protein